MVKKKIELGIARWQGVGARRVGASINANPYKKTSKDVKTHIAKLHAQWQAGWIAEHSRIQAFAKIVTFRCKKGA